MERDILKLQDEVSLLKKKISILERRENRRKAFGYAKIIVKILLTGLFLFGIWKGYEYVRYGIPKLIENEINDLNPFKKK